MHHTAAATLASGSIAALLAGELSPEPAFGLRYVQCFARSLHTYISNPCMTATKMTRARNDQNREGTGSWHAWSFLPLINTCIHLAQRPGFLPSTPSSARRLDYVIA